MDGSLSKDQLLKARFAFDRQKRKGGLTVCGVDEAGRGPLVGRVYTAAVILPKRLVIEGLDDSKKLTEKKREALYEIITEKAVCYRISYAEAAEIDELNILNATMLAMKRAIEGLEVRPDLALIDGNRAPNTDIPCEKIVKGDSLSASIAAASILAKVSRDRYMRTLDERFPEYKFAKHKGYGTKLHYQMIEEHGLCPEHRRSFFNKHKA